MCFLCFSRMVSPAVDDKMNRTEASVGGVRIASII
jgi:hypothetical protein